jgi:hypothetical protein
MIKITCLIVFIMFSSATYSQITKGNWLVGGNANFSYIKASSTAAVRYKQTNFQISPSVGHFVKDKFAVGLRPSVIYGSNNVGNSNTNTIVSIGPFMRYYFLPAETNFNLFTEGNYAYGSIYGKGQTISQRLNTFSISGGPVLYFNSSVGLEFTIGYSSTKVVNFTGRNNELRFGLGFQIHLEKDK